uniref:Uncharacterized protein n=1 Tax=Cacopsylla melanoneura TaxID=428564 RepID=A0A8D8UMI4_9HEMI
MNCDHVEATLSEQTTPIKRKDIKPVIYNDPKPEKSRQLRPRNSKETKNLTNNSQWPLHNLKHSTRLAKHILQRTRYQTRNTSSEQSKPVDLKGVEPLKREYHKDTKPVIFKKAKPKKCDEVRPIKSKVANKITRSYCVEISTAPISDSRQNSRYSVRIAKRILRSKRYQLRSKTLREAEQNETNCNSLKEDKPRTS